MLKRQHKTDNSSHRGPARILVVDDNPDAARLLGKLFRRAGYEVAEVSDHQVALITMMNEPEPISAVVASFSTSGNGSCLKLLDAVRHTPEARGEHAAGDPHPRHPASADVLVAVRRG